VIATALVCAATGATGVTILSQGGDAAGQVRPGIVPSASSAGLEFSIALEIGGGFTPSQELALTNARNIWQSALGDYQPAVLNAGPRPTPVITAVGLALDGFGGVLGEGEPTSTFSQGGFVLASAGTIQFDIADLATLEVDGRLPTVVLHEIGHVLGFGTLWTENGLYVNGSGEYTGTHALDAWRTEFNQSEATFVPVELGGSAGTRNGHWNEGDGGGATGITQASSGIDLRQEVMTGWVNEPTFLSQMTIESFRDLGFAPVPEPEAMAWAAGIITMGLALLRRARRVRGRA
jgi:hypothetical protein